jgi:hypothetical protein
VRKLRETAHGDPAVQEIIDGAEKLIKSGWTVRKGGGEQTKPVPLPKHLQRFAARWSKPPPEWGEK